MKNSLLVFAGVLMLTTTFFACKKADDSDNNNQTGFDKTAMLTYYADTIIIPGYTTMNSKMDALQSATDALVNAPSASAFAAAQTAYKEARIQYMHVEPFQFGPAETLLLDLFVDYSGGLDYNFNTSGTLTGFSVDTATIESNITSGNYNLSAMTRNSFYSQGFPALDYLLFQPGAEAKLTTSGARRYYLKDVVDRMKSLFSQVANGWASYRADFITNTQSNVGSPIGNIINQMSFNLDELKGPRIGWPLGKQSNGTAFPDKVEAYYAGISAALATEAVKTLKNIYTGAGSGKGMADYMIALNHADINTDVVAQFDAAISAIQAIPDPMSATLSTQPSTVDAAYKEVQKLLTLIKTDVASATAVQITYMDNDGD